MNKRCNYFLINLLLLLFSLEVISDSDLRLSVRVAESDSVESNPTEKKPNQANTYALSRANLLHLVEQRSLDIEFFKSAITQTDDQLVIEAIQGAGRIGGDEVIKLLSSPLNSAKQSIRKAAAFSLGISGSKLATSLLWDRLTIEKSSNVRKEIYLALGNLAPNNIIQELLKHYKNEQKPEVIASVFQALTFAVTFHPAIADNIDMRKNQSVIDFAELLALMERDDIISFHAGYFLARIKNLHKRISPAQLQKFTSMLKNINNKKVFAKLIGKIAKKNHLANRRLLSWLIEQSEHSDIGLATESIRAMGNLIYIPQAKIQLGKLQASKQPLIAQTALKSLADSSLQGREIKALFKKQLKNDNPGIVVESIRGLLDRQEREDMTWALKIISHNSPYVKIRFAQMIFDKDPIGFKNVVAMLAKNKDKQVAGYASKLLSSVEETNSSVSNNSSGPISTPDINLPLELQKQLIKLQTTQGEIVLRLNNQALYTGLNFIRLVESGYYNNTYFSRVIGNFVAQGGDTIGDGNGSSGETIREELSYLAHSKMTIGMATAGKDTGDSQFFINLADNIHLDRHYTVFGQVESGKSVALKLSNGDRIISAKVIK